MTAKIAIEVEEDGPVTYTVEKIGNAMENSVISFVRSLLYLSVPDPEEFLTREQLNLVTQKAYEIAGVKHDSN